MRLLCVIALCALAACQCRKAVEGPLALDTGLPRSGQWRSGFTLVDFDGNGTVDLLHGAPRKGERRPHVFVNDGRGHFTRAPETFPALRWDYGDVVSTGDRLVFGVHLSRMLGTARTDAGWQPLTAGLDDPSFSSRAVVAANDDDDPELEVFAVADGPRPGAGAPATLGVRRLDPTPDGYEAKALREEDRRFADSIAAGDLDGDGRADVATGSNTMGETRLVDFTGPTPAPHLPLPERALVRAVVIANVDGDTTKELLLAVAAPRGSTWEHTLVRLDWQDGAWRKTVLLSTPAPLTALAALDIDGDSDLDLATGDEEGQVTVLFQLGNDTFGAAFEVKPAPWRSGCRVASAEGAPLDDRAGDELVLALADEEDAQGQCPTQGGFEVLSQFPRDGRR